MRLIDSEPIIKNLSAMKTQLGYDAIDIDGMIKALREAEEVEATQTPNDPLTISELREMDGEPVWVEMFVKKLKSHWAIVHGKYLSDGRFTDDKERCLLSIEKNSGYGLAFLAYRRKPEEGQT